MASFLQELLVPYKIPFTKRRIGNQCDGGYIVFDKDLDKISSLYSYGINNDVSFELDFTRHSNAPIFMFDHTIEDIPLKHSNFHFIKEPGNTENIIKHINNTCPKNNKLILKMDVEGCEWDILSNLNKLVLCKFEQIMIEFHNLEFLEDHYFGNMGITYSKMINVFSKLNKYFYLGHIHGNNCGGRKDIPNTIECTYIRKDLINFIPEIENKAYPISNLDYPNTPYAPDYILDWWIK